MEFLFERLKGSSVAGHGVGLALLCLGVTAATLASPPPPVTLTATYNSQTGERTGVMVDSPAAPVYRLNPPVAVADMTVTLEFRTTMLYIAPGYAKPVPIRRWDWQWSATAVRGSTNWTVSNATSSLSSPISAPLHPVWTYKVG